jgi:hypothetical protein
MPVQSQIQPEDDRRDAPRHRVRLAARLSSDATKDRNTAVLVEADVINLSSTGLFVEGDPVDDPGAPVRITVRVPISGKAVHLDGRVAWTCADGMGIELKGGPMEDWQLRQLTAPQPRGRR